MDSTVQGSDKKLDLRSILEALLFVGNEDNLPLAATDAAELLGLNGASDVQQLVDELNASYHEEGAAFTIVSELGGYRLALHREFERIGHRFYARLREARLSQAAIDVLAIVAYRQPIRGEAVDALRGAKSGAVLAQLVRRKLLEIERPFESPRQPYYKTTGRFLRLYGLSSLEDLPYRDQYQKEPWSPARQSVPATGEEFEASDSASSVQTQGSIGKRLAISDSSWDDGGVAGR